MEIDKERLQKWVDTHIYLIDVLINECTAIINTTTSLTEEIGTKVVRSTHFNHRGHIEDMAKQFNLTYTERKEENYVQITGK